MSTATRRLISLVSWQTHAAVLRPLREAVFMREQGVPATLEWDGEDERASHLLASTPDGQAIGCARLLSDGHIGRMAVLPAWRRQGIGSALLAMAVEVARQQGLNAVFLDAQTHAEGFYQRHGFVAEGEVFMDAGIPHRHMRRSL